MYCNIIIIIIIIIIFYSYVVCVGLIDELAEYFRSVTGPFEEMGTAHLIISGLNMMLAFIAILHIE